MWSNHAASAEQNPCVPSANDPYYNVTGLPTETIFAARGDDIRFRVTGWSTTPVPNWSLVALFEGGDFAVQIRDPATRATSNLSVAAVPGAPILNNGQQADLDFVVPPTAAGSALIHIDSIGAEQTIWPVLITVR
jgi:hypothetical protein